MDSHYLPPPARTKKGTHLSHTVCTRTCLAIRQVRLRTGAGTPGSSLVHLVHRRAVPGSTRRSSTGPPSCNFVSAARARSLRRKDHLPRRDRYTRCTCARYRLRLRLPKSIPQSSPSSRSSQQRTPNNSAPCTDLRTLTSCTGCRL